MLPEQRSPLAFGHAAPHTELHLVVKRVGEALGGHQTRPANRRGVPLRRSADEQIVGIGEATPRLQHPADAEASELAAPAAPGSQHPPTSNRTVYRHTGS